ncbi:MAG: hypothetical protein V4490_03600 [Pseudomonadota bacterium]
MKKIPYPPKQLKTKQKAKEYLVELVSNAMSWLKIDGYAFSILSQSDTDFEHDADAGFCITVQFPYKKFRISVQESCLKDLCEVKPSNKQYWERIERSIFHEVIHVLVWRIAELGGRRFTTAKDIHDAEEELTDHLAIAFYALLDEHRKGKKLG